MIEKEEVLEFSYQMELDFSEPVQKHQFTLRMIPQSDERQQILECKTDIKPACVLHKGRDSFGNPYVYGEIEHPHECFQVTVHGIASINTKLVTESSKNTASLAPYRFPSQYTKAGQTLKEYFALHKPKIKEKEADFLERILHQIYQDMIYEKDVTNIYTTAEEALTGKKGVCQDYAHIMIALCRLADIPSRYVVGMMEGEGFSHAWVEVCVDGKWQGFDPTNNKIVDNTYIKISHGRDYQDCIVNRGVFRGAGTQTQKVNVIVRK